MFFRTDEKVFEKTPDLMIGLVVAEHIDNTGKNARIADLLKTEVLKQQELLKEVSLKSLEDLAVYHEEMRALGINPNKYPVSVEALLTRCVKRGELPLLTDAVNAGNYISLKYRMPVGAHDIDSLTGDLEVRMAEEADVQNPENTLDGDALTEGETVYISGNTVRTRRYVWRQTGAGRLDESAKNIVFPIDGNVRNEEKLNEALEELAALLEEELGC
ncbi:MAG: hypothetical protein IIY77_07275, partial [Lachnospiraceae bacterium]|nr:hypothetical protein [Lachnospiraceae bacterium]